jgi:uncharacterized protein with GYD domain
MALYLYQIAYTAESLAGQVKNPQDRIAIVGKQLEAAVGAKIVGGGYSSGKFDLVVIIEAADDVTMAACAVAIAAGGALRASQTTPLLSGDQWVAALKLAATVGAQYKPVR